MPSKCEHTNTHAGRRSLAEMQPRNFVGLFCSGEWLPLQLALLLSFPFFVAERNASLFFLLRLVLSFSFPRVHRVPQPGSLRKLTFPNNTNSRSNFGENHLKLCQTRICLSF